MEENNIRHNGQEPARRPPEDEPEHRGDGELDSGPIGANVRENMVKAPVKLEQQTELPLKS